MATATFKSRFNFSVTLVQRWRLPTFTDLLIYPPDPLFHHLQLLRIEVKNHSEITTPGGQQEEVS